MECEGCVTKTVEKGSSPPEGNGPWELQQEDVMDTRNLYGAKEDCASTWEKLPMGVKE